MWEQIFDIVVYVVLFTDDLFILYSVKNWLARKAKMRMNPFQGGTTDIS